MNGKRDDPTNEQIESLSSKIVDKMNTDELIQYVYEDLIDGMSSDQELFECNLISEDLSLEEL